MQMENLRLKIKIGEHEFEADGPADAVQAQVTTFARLIGREGKTGFKPAEPALPPSEPRPGIREISRIDGKIVLLNVPCESLERAVLLLLFGQHELRGNSSVAGSEIMDGLRASGHNVGRADYILKR